MLSRILFCCFALLLCAALPAQKTKDRVKNRAENRTNSNVDRKVDRAVDDAFNAVGNLFKKKKKNKPAADPAPDSRSADTDQPEEATSGQGGFMSALGLGGNNDFEPYTNDKSFSVVMHTTEIKKNGKQDHTRMEIGVLPTQMAMRMGHEDGDARTLFDTQTGKTTMVSTDKKGNTEATRMRIPNFGQSAAMDDAIEDAENNYTFEVTNETKTIDGYVCKKVIARDAETGNVTEGWVTEAIDLTYVDIFGGIAAMFAGGNSKQLQKRMPAPPMAGLMLEGTTTEPNGKQTTVKLTDIKLGQGSVDPTLFDLSGIPVQEAGF